MFSRITKIYKEYKEIKYLAYHDSLTGLLNRNWLYKNYTQISTKFVYFIDINDLHKINEYGHTFGDIHICKIVDSINYCKNNILIRYAGDEFLLFTDIENFITTNDLYSVGCCVINNRDILKSINIADSRMIINKNAEKI